MPRAWGGQSAKFACRIYNSRKPGIIDPIIDELGVLAGFHQAGVAKDR